MIRATTLIVCFILVSLGVLFAQNKTTEQLNQEITNIPYVFQGEIVDVEIYPGDNEGNRLTDENLVYEKNGEAYYVQPDGSGAVGYSIATIQICQVYKGNTLLSKESVQIVTSSRYLNFWKTVDGKLRYVDNINSVRVMYKDGCRNPENSGHNVWKPNHIGQKYVFFSHKSTKCNKNNESNLLFDNYSKLGVDLNSNYYYREKLDNGVIDRKAYFAVGFGKMFKTQDDLNTFLRSVSLNTDNPNKCSSPKKNESPTEKK